MKAAIENIIVTERIRKEVTRVKELAEDIKEKGLLHPITVMSVEGGELKLLAGLRRLRAAQMLEWSEIDVKIVSPADAEAALRIEISENEQREPFTFTEKSNFGKLLEEIEAAKAKERMVLGGKDAGRGRPRSSEKGTDHGPYPISGEAREVIGAKLGMSGRQYDRIKFISENAPQEMIDQLDRGERSIRNAHDELMAQKRVDTVPSNTDIQPIAIKTETEAQSQAEAENPAAPIIVTKSGPGAEAEHQSLPVYQQKTSSEDTASNAASAPAVCTPEPPPRKPRSKNDPLLEKFKAEEAEALRIRREFDALTPEGKIEELRRQLKEERARAATAESDLAREKELRKNFEYHYNGTLDMLRNQLAAAHARIQELEAKYETN